MSNFSDHQLIDVKHVPLLKNAPIREAIIQINFSINSNFDPKNILNLKDQLPSEFTEFKPIHQSAFNFQIDTEKEKSHAQSSSKLIGYRVESLEENKVIIFQINKIIISLLPPYTNWDHFKNHAQNIWEIFRKLLPAIELERVALRYVNELNIPFDKSGYIDFDDYLKCPPNYPLELGKNIESFFTRVVIPYDDAKATIIQTIDNIKKDSISLILDSDVFRTGVSNFSEQELWDTFDRLRLIKDTIFFKSLTDKAIEKYK